MFLTLEDEIAAVMPFVDRGIALHLHLAVCSMGGLAVKGGYMLRATTRKTQ